MTEQIKFNSKMMFVRPSELLVDHSYQRPLSMGRIRSLAKKFDPAGIGTIHVSKRPCGKFYVIDGQHRSELLKFVGLGDKPIACPIYEGISVQDEAHIFRLLNFNHKTSAVDDFHAGLCEGDRECVAIRDICQKHGLTIDKNGHKGTIGCIVELRSIYRRKNGGKTLDSTLSVIREAFGDRPGATEKAVVGGVALFLHKHGDDVDLSRLAHRLGRVPTGPNFVISGARAMQDFGNPGSISDFACATIANLYNKGLRTNQIAVDKKAA